MQKVRYADAVCGVGVQRGQHVVPLLVRHQYVAGC